MKKIFLVMIIGLTSLMAMACGFTAYLQPGRLVKETRQVSNFDAVRLETSGDLEIVHGEKESLTIEAGEAEMKNLTSEIRGNQLVLGWQANTPVVIDTVPIRYILTVKSLREIGSAGSGDTTLDSLEGEKTGVVSIGSGKIRIREIKSTDLAVELNGSGDVRVEKAILVNRVDAMSTGSGNLEFYRLESASMLVKTYGSGQVTVREGKTASLDVSSNGSGDVSMEGFSSPTAQASTLGSGNIRLWVTEKLKANLVGSGDISYYGEPMIQFDEIGSGELQALGKK